MSPTSSEREPVLRLKAMADEQRLRILNVLQDGEICVGDLVTLLGAPQPSVSRNLGSLRRAGLVRVRRSGLWAFHDLVRDGDAVQAALLLALAACGEIPRYAADRALGLRLRRSEGCCPDRRGNSSCDPEP